MNRSEIRSQVEDNVGRTDKTTVINNAINAALKKISAEHLWFDLRTEASVVATADQEYVELASDVRRLSEVRWMDGLNSYRITIRPKSVLVKMWPDFSAQFPNKPRFGYLEGTTLYLVPPPNEALTITYSYYKRHASFTDDTTDVTPTLIDEAVIAYATYRTFKSVGQHEEAVQWFADFADALATAKKMDRHSAIERAAAPRGMGDPVPEDYYINPFIKETP
jgi:hypothetical protein